MSASLSYCVRISAPHVRFRNSSPRTGGIGGGAVGGEGGGEQVASNGSPSSPMGKKSPVVPVGSPPTASKW